MMQQMGGSMGGASRPANSLDVSLTHSLFYNNIIQCTCINVCLPQDIEDSSSDSDDEPVPGLES